MKELTGEQKELIFGYSFGIISEDETRQAEALLASNSAASDFHARLKQTLQPLGARNRILSRRIGGRGSLPGKEPGGRQSSPARGPYRI